MADYAEVTHWNIKQNRLSCRGNTKASSESLSHAAIYEVDSRIKAVIHIHSARLWNKLRNVLPTTPDIAAYGTPEMAESIKLLVQDKPYQTNGIIIMGGHEEGILCYGADLKEAGELLLSYATNF